MPQLDPGQSEKDRPNLDFVSTHGWVNVDVWLAGAGREEAGTSSSAGNDVSVEAKSTFGSATVKLVSSRYLVQFINLTFHCLFKKNSTQTSPNR